MTPQSRAALRSCTAFPAAHYVFRMPTTTKSLVPTLTTIKNPVHTVARKYSQKRMQQIDLAPRPSKKWNQLSAPQKVVRTATTGGNIITILAGMALTGVVVTMFYLEVLSPDSKTNWFNRAVSRIKEDDRCLQLLGQKGSIKAYGEPTADRWTRNRPIASKVKMDKLGVEHFMMRFNVEGDVDKGVVQLHLMKRPGQEDYDYKYLFLDVQGQNRVYLENADNKPTTPRHEKKGLFGIRWG